MDRVRHVSGICSSGDCANTGEQPQGAESTSSPARTLPQRSPKVLRAKGEEGDDTWSSRIPYSGKHNRYLQGKLGMFEDFPGSWRTIIELAKV